MVVSGAREEEKGKMANFPRDQKLGKGNGSLVSGLERFRVQGWVRIAGRSHKY